MSQRRLRPRMLRDITGEIIEPYTDGKRHYTLHPTKGWQLKPRPRQMYRVRERESMFANIGEAIDFMFSAGQTPPEIPHDRLPIDAPERGPGMSLAHHRTSHHA